MLTHKSIISEYISCIVEGDMRAAKMSLSMHCLFTTGAQLHMFLGPSIYLGLSEVAVIGVDDDYWIEAVLACCTEIGIPSDSGECD